MKVTERLWEIKRNNEEFWRRGRKEMMERLFPQVHSGRTDGNHPGWWETLTWSKKTTYFTMEGKNLEHREAPKPN